MQFLALVWTMALLFLFSAKYVSTKPELDELFLGGCPYFY